MVLDDFGSGEPVLEDDRTYIPAPSSEEQAAGVTIVAMIKVAGDPTWQSLPLNGATAQHSYCVDTYGAIEELVVAISNADWENPGRMILPEGRHTTLYATSTPCRQYQGTSSVTERSDGVTWTYSASNLVLGPPDYGYDLSQGYLVTNMYFPVTWFELRSAGGTWTVSGTDGGGCTYSGGGSFSLQTPDGVSVVEGIKLYPGILPGGPTYRGYAGRAGTSDEGGSVDGSYTVTCDGDPSTGEAPDGDFLYIPLEEDRTHVKVAANGMLSGSYQEDGDDGDYVRYAWHLTPVTR